MDWQDTLNYPRSPSVPLRKFPAASFLCGCLVSCVVAGCGNLSDQLADRSISTNPLPFESQVQAVVDGRSESVDLTHLLARDEHFSKLGGLRNLRSIRIDKSEITTAGINDLVDGSQLEVLVLGQTPLNDDGLELLEGIESLRDLRFPNSTVTDDGLRHLLKLDRLRYLVIGGPNITDQGLKTCSRLRQLKSLILVGCPVTDEGVKRLATMESLESLYLNDVNVTEGTLQHLEMAGLHVHAF